MKALKTFRNKLGVTVALLLTPAIALAGTTPTGGPFEEFMTTVTDWATGPLGIGIAIASLLIGAVLGVAKNSPMPALAGIAMAAFIHWGPSVISSIFTDGAVLF